MANIRSVYLRANCTQTHKLAAAPSSVRALKCRSHCYQYWALGRKLFCSCFVLANNENNDAQYKQRRTQTQAPSSVPTLMFGSTIMIAQRDYLLTLRRRTDYFRSSLTSKLTSKTQCQTHSIAGKCHFRCFRCFALFCIISEGFFPLLSCCKLKPLRPCASQLYSYDPLPWGSISDEYTHIAAASAYNYDRARKSALSYVSWAELSAIRTLP